MNRANWLVGLICLSLLLIGGFALDVNAQQPAAPTAPAETKQAPESSPAQPAPQGDSSAQPAQPQQPPSTNTQIETRTERTERVVERPGTFLGVDATVAMVIGAVLVIVVVIGLVAMSRRGDEVRHTHTRHQV
jgi:uncharacterized membrane protein